MIITDDEVELLRWVCEESRKVTGGLDPRDFDAHEGNIADAARVVDGLVWLKANVRYCPLHGSKLEEGRCFSCDDEEEAAVGTMRLALMKEREVEVLRLQENDVLVYRVDSLVSIPDLARERIVRHLKELFGQDRKVLVVNRDDRFEALRNETGVER